jgi:hypothetical protein
MPAQQTVSRHTHPHTPHVTQSILRRTKGKYHSLSCPSQTLSEHGSRVSRHERRSRACSEISASEPACKDTSPAAKSPLGPASRCSTSIHVAEMVVTHTASACGRRSREPRRNDVGQRLANPAEPPLKTRLRLPVPSRRRPFEGWGSRLCGGRAKAVRAARADKLELELDLVTAARV